MLLGALLYAGLTLYDLRAQLARLPLDGYELTERPVKRAGIAAAQAIVSVEGQPAPRTLADVLRIISGAELPLEDRAAGERVFRRLAEAEAAVHGEEADTVHLHDVGAVDAIVDVMGAIAGLRLLGVERLYCSPLPMGEGEVSGPHGRLPVPAPATLALAARAGAPLRAASGVCGEQTTPTGAAIATTLATFGRPEMTLERIGYGAGSRDPADGPNALRLWLGEGAAITRPMLLLETNIDDMTGEMLAYVQELLLGEGAADAWLSPVQMKKGRPGVMLSFICR